MAAHNRIQIPRCGGAAAAAAAVVDIEVAGPRAAGRRALASAEATVVAFGVAAGERPQRPRAGSASLQTTRTRYQHSVTARSCWMLCASTPL